MQKRKSILITTFICLVCVLVTFGVTYIVMSEIRREAESALAQQYNESLDELEDTYEDVVSAYYALPENLRDSELFEKLAYVDMYYRELYYGEIDDEKLLYYLTSGYIEGAGDKYGAYYTADDYQAIIKDSQGKLFGIGVTVTYSKEHDAIEILSVNQGAPADKAGILVGDIITHVEGERVSLTNYNASIDKVRGEKGTSVNLTILRGSTEIAVTATRDEIEIVSISYHKYALDDKIGVIKISEFNDSTPAQFKSAIEALTNDGVTSLVFDVRNNPGGTVVSVIEMLDYLLPKGDLCYVLDADGNKVQTYTSDESFLSKDIKISVLINGSSASAAELFTAALRDYERATIVGVNSYGKGSMQTLYPLPDGGGIKLSTNIYNPPCDVNYNGVGIAPDIEVELDEALKDKNFYKITDEEDNQLRKACEAVGYTAE